MSGASLRHALAEGLERHMRAEFEESDSYTDALVEWAPQDPDVCARFEQTAAYERAYQAWLGDGS
jgi:hypothetical protein